MNWAKIFTLTMAVLCLGASVAFFKMGDWRRGTYFLLCVGINVVMAL